MHVFYLCKANALQNCISNHILKHAFEAQWQELEYITLYSCLIRSTRHYRHSDVYHLNITKKNLHTHIQGSMIRNVYKIFTPVLMLIRE